MTTQVMTQIVTQIVNTMRCIDHELERRPDWQAQRRIRCLVPSLAREN